MKKIKLYYVVQRLSGQKVSIWKLFTLLMSGAYLLVVIDVCSRFSEVEIVISTSAQSTILKLKRVFATHGITEVLKSDNGPPFQSYAFHQFLKEWY